jgi:hypothetical protein
MNDAPQQTLFLRRHRTAPPVRILLADPASSATPGRPRGPLSRHVGRHRSRLRAAVRAIAGKAGEP